MKYDFEYKLGQFVKKYESGKRGCTTIAQCGNDGGASFGTYQLTMSWGNVFHFIRKYFLNDYVRYGLYFRPNKMGDAKPTWYGKECCNRPDYVKEVWKYCIEKVGKEKFEEYEHAYIKANYYDVTNGYFKSKLGVNIETLSIAWKESIWACSVRDGSKTAYLLFRDSGSEVLFSEESFDKYYDIREKKHPDGGRYKKGSDTSERECLRIFLDDYIPDVKAISNNSPIPLIMWLQFKLGKLEIDGKWGIKTAERVRNYFRVKGWKEVSGYAVGDTTIKSLL